MAHSFAFVIFVMEMDMDHWQQFVLFPIQVSVSVSYANLICRKWGGIHLPTISSSLPIPIQVPMRSMPHNEQCPKWTLIMLLYGHRYINFRLMEIIFAHFGDNWSSARPSHNLFSNIYLRSSLVQWVVGLSGCLVVGLSGCLVSGGIT